MSEAITAFFELDVDEIEVLLAYHMSKDGEDQDVSRIDALYDAAFELGGDPIEIERIVEVDKDAAFEGDEGIEHLADVIEALVEGQNTQTDAILELNEAVERDFEEQYPKHWSMLFHQGILIDELINRVKKLEARKCK